MWKTILRRVLLMIPELVILSVVIFLLAKLMPGDPFTGMVTPQTSPKAIEALRIKAGVYDPWYVQYWHWIVRMFHGDLGMSYQFKTPVGSLILSRMGNTIWLSLLTLILSYTLAIPLGLVAGRYENSKLDKAIMIYTFVAYAIPAFVFYMLGIWLFGYKLQLFPTSGSVSVDAIGTVSYLLSRLDHMILPACLMALLSVTTVVQYLRSEVIDNKNQDYVKTARAKGVPEKQIFTRHIFRNSLLPIAAFLGYSITGLLGGSIFIEQIFNYPGMGLLFMDSILNRDYSVITALVLLYGTLTLIGSLLSDIILSLVDPRVRIG
ncbi:oligopeptide ABC transporter permease [uncultured Ligilactobacillus sp.]|uniref:oligopeptide ABC transporter permease n=1 Tax=uncultured Ligilactobacillus sp. TaxID=2837633 RepID=UPI00272D01FD|nr:oligopeptide ABC transporter permease [uncultured Ligilactobacillus sp.]